MSNWTPPTQAMRSAWRNLNEIADRNGNQDTPEFRSAWAEWESACRNAGRLGTDSRDSTDPCPEWSCPDLSAEDRREGKTCRDHPCTCSADQDQQIHTQEEA